MTYDFSFDKKSLSFLLVGVAFIGLLLFLAGWVTGSNWNKPETLSASTFGDKAVAATEAEQPALPREPTLRETGLRREAPAAATAPDEPLATAKQSVAPPRANVGIDSMYDDPKMSAQESAKASAKAAAPKGNADPVIVSTAAQSNDSADSADTGEKTVAFSIQVGVFLEEKDADRLVEEMKEKGYTPSVFAALDVNNRMWYSVRIGAYVDRAEASQAAASFTKQEKLKAVVRPFDSL